MTRASLLHILDHVNGISDVEIRELEQLAAAFPYCQTAHVLLAKAAHDRGSMLAGQRLRRAATYATDRDLLRQLLESTAVVAPPPPAADEPAAPLAAPERTPLLIPNEAPAPEAAADEPAAPLPENPEATAEALQPAPGQPATDEHPALAADTELALAPHLQAVSPEAVVPELAPENEPLFVSHVPDLPVSSSESAFPEAGAGVTADAEPAPSASEAPAAEPVAEPSPEPADDLLPAVAPPIRPPADAGISRFEFGLGQSALPAPVAYQLPGLEDEDEDELPTLSKLPLTPQPVVTAPFRADADLGYALGAGSRLGYDLQARDGYTLDLPLDAFFEPDALLLAHLKAHKPKPAASSLDLINRFLKAQPRIKTPAGVPLPAEQQPDLSVRSASVAPALASESLAKIMVRQGKKDKAIEIYERLMERQPEKKAYFAEQIQQLQQPSE